MKKFALIAFAVSAFACANAGAQAAPASLTGNNFAGNCDEGSSQYSYCLGYVSGYAVGVNTQAQIARLSPKEKIFCWPDRATFGQATEIFNQYLKKNPSQRHENANLLLGAALMSAFPCK